MNESLQLIASVVDQGESLAFLVSPTGDLLHASRAMLIALGTTADAALRSPLHRFYAKPTYQQLQRVALPAVSSQGRWDGEGVLEPLDGQPPLPVRMRMYVARNACAEVLCLLIEHYPDIDRQRAEAAESLKDALLDSSLDPIVLVNAEGRIVEFNRAAQRSFGYSREQVLNLRPEEVLFPPDSEQIPTQRVERHLMQGAGSLLGRRTEVMARRANGELFPAEMAMTISSVGGSPLFAFFLRDLSLRMQAEQSLRESEMRLQSILDNTPAVVYVKGLDGKYELINRSFETLFHVTRDSLVGATDYDVFPGQMADAFRANDLKVRDARAPLLIEEIAPHDDGPHTYISVKFPLLDAAGEVRAVCGISTDITQRIRVEEVLRQAKNAAEAANKAKSAFLANMSHEIRTPLNAIIGLTELVLQGIASPDHREYLAMVCKSGESLLSVINDVLDFSKIEAGKLDLEHVAFEVREVVQEPLKALDFRARAKGLKLDCQIAPDVPAAVLGDPMRLRQTIVNLVGNAIKFTEQGSVSLDVRVRSRNSNEVVLHFAVRDTGIGIPREKHEQIFAAFEQADVSMSRRFGGTGLGLAISRRLVELAGGSIWVESELDQGSTFHFLMPFGWTEQTVLPAVPACQLPPLDVLLAEDSLVNQKLAVGVLERQGHRVTVANNGREAVEASQQNHFDLILMDVQMPELDGLEATAAIRRKEATTGGHVPIIAMTAHAMKGDRQRCLSAGMDGYLAKPVRGGELMVAIAEALGRQEARASSIVAPVICPTASAESISSVHAPPGEKILDWDSLLTAMEGDLASVCELAAAFEMESCQVFAEIENALLCRDASVLHRAAHTLQGSARVFGCQVVQQAALHLEQLARDQQFDPAHAAAAELRRLVNSLVAELRRHMPDNAIDRGCR